MRGYAKHGVLDRIREAGGEVFAITSEPQTLASAAQGMGIALGQQPYTERDLQSGALVEVFPGTRVNNPSRWYLVCRDSKRNLDKLAVFRNWLLSEIQADDSLRTDQPAG